MIKNVQHISTMFPIGRNDDNSVCTTNFNPGARLITLKQRKIYKLPNLKVEQIKCFRYIYQSSSSIEMYIIITLLCCIYVKFYSASTAFWTSFQWCFSWCQITLGSKMCPRLTASNACRFCS